WAKMADPIMDLFEDTPLFNLDTLPDDSFSQGSSDPVEEALKLALGQAVPTEEPESTPDLAVSSSLGVPVAAPVISDPAPVHVPTQQPVPVAPVQTVSVAPAIEAGAATFMTSAPVPVETVPQMQAQSTIPVASNTSGVSSTTVLLSSPLTVSSSPATTTTATTQQLTQITHQLTPQQLAAITQQAGGKIVILKGPQGQAQVLQTVSGTTGQTGGKVIRLLSGTTLKPGMSILQGGTVLNQASPGQTQVKVGATGVQRLLQSANGPVKQVLLTSMPQQTQAGSATPGGQAVTAQQQVTPGGQQQQTQTPARLVLGQLPSGKLVLQGSQLAALTQARAAGQAGGQPKVLTIQLQVQQQPNQQGGVKAIRITKAPGEPAAVRRVEILCKQEKANRIVAEAIARAKARGEKNLPRVLNQDELPTTQTSPEMGGRRSNRVVKRKKYTEDLDIKITDDEDEQEDVDVTTTAAAVASISGGAAAQLKQEVELDGDGLPSMQFFVDEEPFNPDYVEVDRILDVSHSVDKDNGEARPAASAWKKLEETREYKNSNTLREYQLEGVNWLLFNWYNRQNCILADEMGLGKTIQSITLLSEVYATGIQGPFLVIAPLSTITNWEREFSTWTHMNAIVYHGSLASRQMIQQYEIELKLCLQGHLIPGAYKFDALITTFEMVLSDCPELREIAWRCVIIDEAHRLKNRNCKLLDSLKMLDLALIRSAGKLVLLDKLLPRLKAGGHKVLIFSQMVRCLDILEDYLINKRYLYERIDGRVRGNLRQAAIDRFSKPDSDRFVFLLCTRAGGLGINLTAADTCVIFDSDWNPQNDLQVQYSTICLQQFSKKEIEDLLRKGAYAAIMDENDEGSRFCEEDIDQILQRRATTITIESEGKGSTFSKASFVASENRTDIALDDPEFWQKWAKKADIDMDSFNQKVTLEICIGQNVGELPISVFCKTLITSL
ncbi:hypothetical protein XENOCAPTIV_023765, partial [Xenoophorus captivus]